MRTKIVGLTAAVALSAATMLWLLWHHPVTTIVVTIVLLAALALSARLARLVDTSEGLSDLDRGNRSGSLR